MSAADKLLSGLHRVRKTGPASWSACCPAHEDRSPSLAVRETDDGRVLLHCFGGCSTDAVLGAVGLTLSDLFPPSPKCHEGRQRERRAWSAADLLRMVAYESMLVALVASDLVNGRSVSDTDRARMHEAVSRLQDAADAING